MVKREWSMSGQRIIRAAVFYFTLLHLGITGCRTQEKKLHVPEIGFMDAFKDETLEQANREFTVLARHAERIPGGRQMLEELREQLQRPP